MYHLPEKMNGNSDNIKYNSKKPSKLLDDFVESYWEHTNLSDKHDSFIILPDSFFKLIFIYQEGNLIKSYITGLSTKEFEVETLPNTTLYGMKFRILAPEYIFQSEIGSIIQSNKNLSPEFMDIQNLAFCDLDCFANQIEPILFKMLSKTKKQIKANKLQLSQLLYQEEGKISATEVSNQINWSNRQINRYLNKYLGVSLKTYLNIQKCHSSYFHISKGELYPGNHYFDQSHFIREIKKHTGKTPKEIHRDQNDRFIQLKTIQKK